MSQEDATKSRRKTLNTGFLIYLNNYLIDYWPEIYRQSKAKYERIKTKENESRAKESVE